jgi:primase-polymerase (primpol)-like protein
MTGEPPSPADVPDALTAYGQWVGWRSEERDGKQTKIPIDPSTGQYASSTDPETWGEFEAAADVVEGGDCTGIGFVFTDEDPFVGVDLDDCRDSKSGEPEQWAAEIIETLNSYTEVSPSGTGYHVLVRGTLPEGRNRHGDVELYETARYFTVTGAYVGRQRTIHERTEELAAVHRTHVAQTPEDTGEVLEAVASVPPTASSGSVGLSDEKLLEKARSAQNGQKFGALWQGDTSGYDSHSEADMALCCLLAFWTGRDRGRVDRLFRESGLLRGKWDEIHYADGATYGERTVERALQVTTDVYDPEHAGEDEDTSDAERGDATQPSDRSHASLVERNRLLREQIDRLETDLEDADERIESLQATVEHLEADLAEREQTIDTLREEVQTPDSQSRESRGVWGRAKRAFERDASE